MNTDRNYLLYTEKFALAQVEVILHGGSLIKRYGEQTILVELPENVRPCNLIFASSEKPEILDEEGMGVTERWNAWDQSFLPMQSS